MRRVLPIVALLLLAGCGGDDPPKPPPTGVASHTLTLRSEAVHRTLQLKALDPRPAPDGAPMLVLLHGQGSSPEAVLLPELVRELERLGERAPVVLAPDGDEASYWHDRASGAWGRMVVDEAIPEAARRLGGDPQRVAIAGLSMGGFGALHLAAAFPDRFCSVAAHSPAVFKRVPRRGSPFEDAFDGRFDFERNDVIEQARRLPEGTWVDIGDDDPFAPAVRTLVEAMPAPRYREWDGGHDFTYWLNETRAWLRFHVDRCS